MKSLSTALKYIEQGWSPLPLPYRSKGGKELPKDWQKIRIKADTARQHFDKEQMNIGVILGEASNGLTDIDFDSPEALRLQMLFLPRTEAAFGRASSPRSHLLYYQTKYKEVVRFIDPAASAVRRQWLKQNPDAADSDGPDTGALIEFRADGQTVFPGSTHKETGEPIEWTARQDGRDADTPSHVDGDELYNATAYTAAACLLLRYWPERGSKLSHTLAGALGGFFGRIGGDLADNAGRIVEVIAVARGDHEVEDRRRAAEDAIATLKDKPNRKVPGLPKMREILGVEVANAVAEWFGYMNQGGLLAEMNEKYFVIELGGKVTVGTFKTDAVGNKVLIHYSFSAFRDLLDNVMVGKLGKGSWWLKQAGRRQYTGVAFEAGERGAIVDTEDRLNLWQGFGVDPIKGDWNLMERHIFEVLANGVEAHATYIQKWLAWAVQNPSKRAEVMLILKSEEEGTGKGALANAMVRIFGDGVNGIRIDKPKQLTGDFNAHLQRAVLLYADEAHWPGNKADEGAYKGLITEPSIAIQPKGIDIYLVRNVTHIICTSNNDWVAPAGPTSRRLAVFRVNPKHAQSQNYFKPLFQQMDNGGLSAMLYDLLEMDLGDWHPRQDIPQTAELLHQKLQSLDSELKWMLDLLTAGRLPGSGNKYVGVYECPSEWLFDDYIRHAGKTGARYKSIATTLGHKLRNKWFLDCKPRFNSRDDASYPRGGEDGGTKQGMIYQFPPLSECRKAFERIVNGGQPMSWEGPSDWLPSMENEEEADARIAQSEDPAPAERDESIPF